MARRGSNNDDIVVNGDGSYDYNDIDGDLELRGNFRLPDIPNPSSAPRCPDDDEDDNGYGNDDDDGGYNPLLSSEYDDEEIDNTNNVGIERLGSAGSSHSCQPREPRMGSTLSITIGIAK